MTANLQNIARRAGVSATTVSRALHGNYPVAQETIERIRKAMNELDYDDHVLSQRFLERKPGPLRHTGNIGLILGDIFKKFSDPYWSGVLDGVTEEAQQQNYHLRFTFTRDDVANEQQRRLLNHANIDGLLLVARQLTNAVEHEIAPEFLVAVEHGMPSPLSVLSIDNVEGEKWNAMKAMVTHLISLGHRRFRFITGDFSDLRTQGYKDALNEHGIPVTDEQFVYTPWTIEGAYEAVEALLRNKNDEVDALVCASDMIAVAAIRAANAHGMRVPEDIAITGYDDMPYARDLDPPLTTVSVQKELLGRFAVRKLIERIHNPTLPPIVQVIPTTLVIRRSCGSPLS